MASLVNSAYLLVWGCAMIMSRA